MSDAGSSPTTFASGAIIGDKYTLQRRLGSGAVGDIWAAVNRATRATVALKLVGKGTVSRDAAARFRHEASLSAPLAHRNIVRVYDFLEEPDGTLVLVMELLRGENARERLLRTGLLPASSAVSIATQILSALAHAHAHGIFHRDVKPPNIFLATEPDGGITPKLLDFGIAKTEASTVHTLNGQLLGTPRYMSPEQIRAAETLDGRSDLFSLATVLYELLTGRCPFAAAFSTASLALVLDGQVAPDPRIAPPLWRVLETALAKDRDQRFATAEALADALREAIETSDASLSRVLLRSSPPPRLVIESPVDRAPRPAAEAPEEDVAFAEVVSRRRARARRIALGSVAASAAVIAFVALRLAVVRPAPGRAPEASSCAVPAALPSPAPVGPTTDAVSAVSRESAPEVPREELRATADDTSVSTRLASAREVATRAKTVGAAAPARAPSSTSALQTRTGLVKDPGF